MRPFWRLILLAGLAGAALVGQSSANAAPAGPLAITDTPSPTVPSATDTPTPTASATVPTPTPSPTLATPTASPTWPAPTATPGDPQIPLPAAGGVVIVKSASVQQASVGDQVDYFLAVSNPHAVSLPDVTVVDALAPELDYLTAASPQGSVAYEPANRTVTFGLGALAPGQTVNLTIVTRINSLAQAPAEIRNLARAALSAESNVSVVLVVPGSLPTTGHGPGLRELLALGAVLALLLVAAIGLGAVSIRPTTTGRR